MSVETSARRQQFTLDGATAAFTFTFRALTSMPSDIKCIRTSGGTDTDLVYTTDFSVSVNSNGVGGTVTLVSPSAVGTGTLTIYRETTNTQESDYDDYNQFPANTLENDLDIRTLVSQEQAEALDRILQLPISYTGTASTTLPTPTADTVIGWNAAGSALENKTITPSSSFQLATLSQAQAGTENTTYMSPLRVFQAIAAKLLVLAAAVNFAKGADIASATTTDIGAATGNFVHITGTVTITGLGTVQAGTIRHVRFAGALTLTYNASSLILPGAASITTAANDVAVFVSEGSGNWRCLSYQKASGAAVVGSSGGTLTSAKKLLVTRSSTTTVNIQADEVVLEDSSNNKYVARSVAVNCAITASGANGLDSGAEASSTWYYQWLIYNGTTVASVTSTSSTTPVMPSGYTYKALVSAVRNDGSSNYIDFKQTGNQYEYVTWISMGSGVTALWATLDMSSYVPSGISDVCYGNLGISAGTMACANNSSASSTVGTPDGNKIICSANSQNSLWYFRLLTADALYWGSNDASGNIRVGGFILNKLA